MGMSFAHSHSINYERLRRVMSYDWLRQVMMRLRHSCKLVGVHIITLAKQAYNIWRSQIHNSKLVTLNEKSQSGERYGKQCVED